MIIRSQHSHIMKSWRRCYTQECAKVVSAPFSPYFFSPTQQPLPDLHTARGTAASASGTPIINIKFPHVGGHEGVGRIVTLGPGIDHKSTDIYVGMLVGIRFASRICRRCEFCLAGKEQHCIKATNHLHHEDGSFQEYIALDADYLTILPQDVDPVVVGPVLCAGVTAYKAR